MTPPRLLVTMGDPAGVGPEVLLKTLSALPKKAPRFIRAPSSVSISVIGDVAWLKRLARRLRIGVPWGRVEWIDLAGSCSGTRPGKIQPSAVPAIELAVAWI